MIVILWLISPPLAVATALGWGGYLWLKLLSMQPVPRHMTRTRLEALCNVCAGHDRDCGFCHGRIFVGK